MKEDRILSAEEQGLIEKLCKPEPFFPTAAERAMLRDFKRRGIVMVHGDGSVEVTDLGAELYLDSKYGRVGGFEPPDPFDGTDEAPAR